MASDRNTGIAIALIAGIMALIGAIQWSRKKGEDAGWLLTPGQNTVPGAEAPSYDWDADLYQGGMSGGGGASGSFLVEPGTSGSASSGSIFDQWWEELTEGIDWGGYDTPSTSIGGTVSTTLDDIYRKYGTRYGVDWRLLKAHAIIESGENPNALNPSDPSYGVMQVLCRPDGKGGCSNTINVDGWPPSKAEDLYNADYNVKLASQILRWNLQTYGFPKGIAVYNNWSARTAPDTGPFPNADYVNKVLEKYYALQKSHPA